MASEAKVTVTVKVPDTVSDGEGGFFAKGAKVEVEKATAESLKEQGYVA